MQFYRLIQPNWAQKSLSNGKPNPEFIEAIPGDKTIEGCNFTPEFLKEKNDLGYNVYFFPNHPSKDVYAEGTKYLNGRVIDVFNYVYVDMDLKDKIYASKEEFLFKLAEFPLKPSMVVDSGNGVHAYWKISDLTRETYTLTQMSLLTHFNTDDSVWTVLQLMRYPGLNNMKKHKEPKLAAILTEHSSSTEYTFDQIPKDIFSLPPEKVIKVKNHINRLDGKIEIQLTHEANIDELPDSFVNLMSSNEDIAKLFNDPKSYNGDRSSADMKLANVIYNKGLGKKDALRVIANSQKALEKGPHRFEYAQLTIDKVYVDRTKNKFKTVAERLNCSDTVPMADKVLGPAYLDFAVLGKPWRKKQITGIIAGSGVGKTAFTLNIFKEMIENNKENDEVFVFVSLEMPEEEINERWIELVGENSPLAKRLYVIANEDENGEPRNIGLQEVYEYCSDIKLASGKEIRAIALDHFGIWSSHIDTTKKHKFGIESEQNAGYGIIKNLSENRKADQMKTLVKMLNTHLFILTQTTKEKGVGDLPIAKDGAYGLSNYENIVDRIITLWQPLMRVQHLTNHRFLAWQYAKNRHIHKTDKIKVYEPKLLTYDMDSGSLALSNSEDFRIFSELLPQANEAREALQKKKADAYSIMAELDGIEDLLKNLGV